jgi:hypothetical protein
MRFKSTRTDRLSPEERAIVDRFERGEIDAAEAGRLLIASVHSLDETAVDEGVAGSAEADADPEETPEDEKARLLIERLAREAYDDPA